MKTNNDISDSFTQRHFGQLVSAGIMSAEYDAESFKLMADIWAELQTIDRVAKPTLYVNLLKQYLAFAKQFGMLPRERAHSRWKPQASEAKDEYGL